MVIHYSQTQALKALVGDALTEINATFENGMPSAGHQIDELCVMMDDKGAFLTELFTSTQLQRVVDVDVLWPIVQAYYDAHIMDGVRSGEIFGMDGQEGEDFDFVLALRHKEKNYFLFANYLGGTLEDLHSNPQWKMAKAQFTSLGKKMVEIIDPPMK